MGLLSTLKSLLGMEEESRSAGSGVDVTVEHEPSTESERAVQESGAEHEAEAEDGESVDEPVATETDAAASTESLVDEEHTDDPTRAAEPAEAASTGEEEVESVDGEPVTVLKGIGPAYADRLEDAGIESVADLAAADPEELAERVDLSAKRVGRWVDTAQDHA